MPCYGSLPKEGRAYRFRYAKPARRGLRPLHPPLNGGDIKVMAIYHLTVSTGSRKGGQSARAKIDYILREGKYNGNKDKPLYAESGNMPAWARPPKEYWKAADAYERANARLFREIEFALPRELTLAQNIELVRDFVREVIGDDLPYTLAIHGGRNGDNPHCHLVFSERLNDGVPRSAETWFRRAAPKKKPAEMGGAPKTDRTKSKAWLEKTRETWARVANQALERAGHDARIDHRSYADRGIERVPQPKLGPAAAAMERRGIRTERGDMLRAAAVADLEIARLNAETARLRAIARKEVQASASVTHTITEPPRRQAGGRGDSAAGAVISRKPPAVEAARQARQRAAQAARRMRELPALIERAEARARAAHERESGFVLSHNQMASRVSELEAQAQARAWKPKTLLQKVAAWAGIKTLSQREFEARERERVAEAREALAEAKKQLADQKRWLAEAREQVREAEAEVRQLKHELEMLRMRHPQTFEREQAQARAWELEKQAQQEKQTETEAEASGLNMTP